MEWIKCSDRLPKTEGGRRIEDVCLVVVHKPEEAPEVSPQYSLTRCPEYNDKREFVGYSDFKWCWYDDIADSYVDDDNEFVTHWMPYPEPPKESGDE
jgi:hypothetical protein